MVLITSFSDLPTSFYPTLVLHTLFFRPFVVLCTSFFDRFLSFWNRFEPYLAILISFFDVSSPCHIIVGPTDIDFSPFWSFIIFFSLFLVSQHPFWFPNKFFFCFWTSFLVSHYCFWFPNIIFYPNYIVFISSGIVFANFGHLYIVLLFFPFKLSFDLWHDFLLFSPFWRPVW